MDSNTWGEPSDCVWMRRFKNGVDIGTVPVPKRDVDITLKAHPDWIVIGEISLPKAVPQPEQPSVPTCPLCGTEFKTEQGLKIHKVRKHK